MVKLYSKNNCVQCRKTKDLLDRAGIAYEEINLDENEEARFYLKGLGFSSAPVVVTLHDSWAGFRPDKIKKLSKKKDKMK